jgi:hypothetical protein
VPAKPGLMRSLGRFVGQVSAAVRAKPGERREVSRTSEQRTETTPDGRTVVVRRTTVEEIEVRDGA